MWIVCRWFTWNVKTCFLWKIQKKNFECCLLQILLGALRVKCTFCLVSVVFFFWFVCLIKVHVLHISASSSFLCSQLRSILEGILLWACPSVHSSFCLSVWILYAKTSDFRSSVHLIRTYATLLRPLVSLEPCMLGFWNFIWTLVMKNKLTCFFFFFSVKFFMVDLGPFSDLGILANENLVSKISTKEPLELGS